MLGCFSRVQLFVTPWTVAQQAPLSMRILQARMLEWVAMPSSRPGNGSHTHLKNTEKSSQKVRINKAIISPSLPPFFPSPALGTRNIYLSLQRPTRMRWDEVNLQEKPVFPHPIWTEQELWGLFWGLLKVGRDPRCLMDEGSSPTIPIGPQCLLLSGDICSPCGWEPCEYREKELY